MKSHKSAVAITFICTNQETVCSPLNQMHRQLELLLTDDLLLQGHWGKEDAAERILCLMSSDVMRHTRDKKDAAGPEHKL